MAYSTTLVFVIYFLSTMSVFSSLTTVLVLVTNAFLVIQFPTYFSNLCVLTESEQGLRVAKVTRLLAILGYTRE